MRLRRVETGDATQGVQGDFAGQRRIRRQAGIIQCEARFFVGLAPERHPGLLRFRQTFCKITGQCRTVVLHRQAYARPHQVTVEAPAVGEIPERRIAGLGAGFTREPERQNVLDQAFFVAGSEPGLQGIALQVHRVRRPVVPQEQPPALVARQSVQPRLAHPVTDRFSRMGFKEPGDLLLVGPAQTVAQLIELQVRVQGVIPQMLGEGLVLLQPVVLQRRACFEKQLALGFQGIRFRLHGRDGDQQQESRREPEDERQRAAPAPHPA